MDARRGVEELHLGVPLDTTLSPGEFRFYRVEVGVNETLRIRLISTEPASTNEIFVRYNDVPSGFAFDASAEEIISASPTALIPSTKAGDYYVLIQGRSSPNSNVQVTVLAETLPFTITDVTPDQGGDSRWVTMTIRGAQFKPDAVVKLVRPGLEEIEPARYEVIDATRIIATFDFREREHALYDVKVINPDGAEAIVPYRYLIERALEIDVTIGLGGPRVVPASQAGLYSVSLQSLTNVDTPYVYFQFGAPEIGDLVQDEDGADGEEPCVGADTARLQLAADPAREPGESGRTVHVQRVDDADIDSGPEDRA